MDTSNKISYEDGKKAFDEIEQWVRNLPKLKKLSVYGLPANENSALEKKGKSWCIPKDGKNANSLYENPRHAEITFKGKFLTKIKRLFNELVKQEEKEQSPIIETIAELTQESNDIDSFFIVSDMLQNTSLASHYKNVGDMKKLCETIKLKEVKIYYINRNISQQSLNSKHKRKWEKCFSNSENLVWVR